MANPHLLSSPHPTDPPASAPNGPNPETTS
jgi:hypothetical protein